MHGFTFTWKNNIIAQKFRVVFTVIAWCFVRLWSVCDAFVFAKPATTCRLFCHVHVHDTINAHYYHAWVGDWSAVFGALSDKFGRKKPLIISLVIYIISTIAIVFSPNIETMIVLRVVQGLSSAGSVVISRAIVADLYKGQAMTRFFGLLLTINGLAPIFSPITGSFLLEFTDWRGIFVFLPPLAWRCCWRALNCTRACPPTNA